MFLSNQNPRYFAQLPFFNVCLIRSRETGFSEVLLLFETHMSGVLLSFSLTWLLPAHSLNSSRRFLKSEKYDFSDSVLDKHVDNTFRKNKYRYEGNILQSQEKSIIFTKVSTRKGLASNKTL